MAAGKIKKDETIKMRIILLAAACAALVACNKENESIDNPSKGAAAFREGQEVTIGVSSGKVFTKVTGTDDGEKINLVWEKGDSILVTVGDKSAKFVLSSGAGSDEAEFTGTMPGSGSSFVIQYPATTPDLSSQAYVEGKIPSGKLTFIAEDCTLDKAAELEATNSILQLKLYGAARSVDSIAVTNKSDSKTYTLTCSTAKVLGKNKDNATPFYIVVPTGSYKFDAKFSFNVLEPTSDDNIPEYETYGSGIPVSVTAFSTSSAQTFTAGQALNMPAKCVTVIWAPVNCGYDSTNYKYGKLYQWGRYYGCGYIATDSSANYNDVDTGQTNTSQNTQTSLANEDSTKFYLASGDWNSDGRYYNLWDSSISAECTTTGHLPTKNTDRDPCPEGWRVPTYAELYALIGYADINSLKPQTYNGQIGHWFDGTNVAASANSGLFLPAAGRRQGNEGTDNNRGAMGYYWSSSAQGGNKPWNAWYFYFESSGKAFMYAHFRTQGNSIRCIQN